MISYFFNNATLPEKTFHNVWKLFIFFLSLQQHIPMMRSVFIVSQNDKVMEKKCLLIPFFGSLLVFLLTCWTAAFRGPSAEWAESVSFFLFTYCMLERYAKKDTDGIPVVLMIMLGRIILEIPIRIDYFSGTIGSLFVTIVVLIAIVLSMSYWYKKKLYILILSLVIMMLLNTFGHDLWLKHVWGKVG